MSEFIGKDILQAIEDKNNAIDQIRTISDRMRLFQKSINDLRKEQKAIKRHVKIYDQIIEKGIKKIIND